jgi:RTX calcium-binding nonapeptide repeat (4 copies)
MGAERVRRRTAAAALVAVGVVMATPGAGLAATPTSVSVFSDTGEFIGRGEARTFLPPTAQVTVSGTAGNLTVHAAQGNVDFSMRFAAPAGDVLRSGVYEDVEDPVGRPAGTAGMAISEEFSCTEVDGRFEVRDIATDAGGAIQRLWIAYEQRCDGHIPALFGEIRFNEQVNQAFTPAAPFVIRWPAADLGRDGRSVPVTLVPEHTTKLVRTLVTGDDASAFPIRSDDCIGKSLAAGASCQVWVAFTPNAPGPRSATLHVEDARGHDTAALLQGFAYGGTTRVVLDSEAGDPVGAGQDRTYTPANALIEPTGSPQHVHFEITGGDGAYWNADLVAPDGETLAPGTYTNALRYPLQGTGPGLGVSGESRACTSSTGQFTIAEAAFDDDGPLRFASSFEQTCTGSTGTLRGNLDFRAGDTSTPAPWMTSRTGATSLPFTPPHTQPSSGPCSGSRFSGAWVVVGTSGDDSLAGTSGMDIISGLDGRDAVGGAEGDDCIDGGPGDDRLLGGAGNDLIAGGKGGDALVGGPGQDKFRCGDGDDTVYAEPGESVDADCEHVNR